MSNSLGSSPVPVRLSNAQWLWRFCIAVMPLVWLVGLRYLPWISIEGNLAPFYLLLLYIGHLSLFPILLLLPLLLFVHLPDNLFRLLGAGVITVLLTLLLVDTLVYDLYRFHINSFVLEMVFLSGTDTFELSADTYLIGAGALVAVLVAVSLMVWLARYLSAFAGKVVITAVLVCLVGAHGIHAWSDANYDTRITGITRHIPLYFGTTSKRFFVANGLVDPQKARGTDLTLRTGSSNLRYPLEPMVCSVPEQPLNVLIILVDALRADTVTPKWMPNIARFRERASDFGNHFSGGNSTLAGVFSMFYGLPSNYWDAFYGAQHPPVMMQRVMEMGYQPLILSSATLVSPAFDRTVFAGVPDIRLRTPGKTMWEKDQLITDDWLAFTAARNESDAPFFGFIFYSAVHAYGPPDDYPRFEPYWEEVNHLQLSNSFDPEPYLNVYRTAAHYVDSQVGRVLADLQQRGLLDNTVVMISSDHGEEFNDNGLDYWGHGSNFSDVQLHVPMILHWPQRERQQVSYRTTHHDVPATFLREAFGCAATAAEQYSVGHSLFEAVPRDLLIAGSYANYAAVLDQHIVVSYPGGGHDVLDKKLNKAPESVLQPEISRRILTQLSRFYR
jgi:membrane-anchored protein YejM (alkaline phosphatase superfamily)